MALWFCFLTNENHLGKVWSGQPPKTKNWLFLPKKKLLLDVLLFQQSIISYIFQKVSKNIMGGPCCSTSND